MHMDVVYVDATHGLFEHVRQWLNGQGKEERRQCTPLSHTLFSAEWLSHSLSSNDLQCDALCCGHQSLHTNAIASHVKQHLLKPLMVHQVMCLGPVHHHDDTISVGINQAVD